MLSDVGTVIYVPAGHAAFIYPVTVDDPIEVDE